MRSWDERQCAVTGEVGVDELIRIMDSLIDQMPLSGGDSAASY